MEHGDVVFEFRLAELAMLLLVLFLIYGITWLKKVIEGRSTAAATASAGDSASASVGASAGDEPPAAGSRDDDPDPAA